MARGGEVIRTQPPLPIVYVESHCDNIRVISLRYITDIILISLVEQVRDQVLRLPAHADLLQRHPLQLQVLVPQLKRGVLGL